MSQAPKPPPHVTQPGPPGPCAAAQQKPPRQDDVEQDDEAVHAAPATSSGEHTPPVAVRKYPAWHAPQTPPTHAPLVQYLSPAHAAPTPSVAWHVVMPASVKYPSAHTAHDPITEQLVHCDPTREVAQQSPPRQLDEAHVALLTQGAPAAASGCDAPPAHATPTAHSVHVLAVPAHALAAATTEA